jgi:glycosyltransferase involved in cell wall biosynthesis
MKTVLMVAFHYPPILGSSGVHRTLSFCRYLPQYGWRPIVLTASSSAYPRIEPSQWRDIPAQAIVERAFALDTARHLALRGLHLQTLALPDRWISWWPAAVVKGLRLIRRYRPDVLWSTYPIATAHMIGLTLHRLTGIRWIADFRDPMRETDPLTGEEYPFNPTLRRIHTRLERATMRHCRMAVFTTPGAVRMYSERYPDRAATGITAIANGFDEESFHGIDRHAARPPSPDRPIILLHSGILYASARDPSAFFAAMAELRRANDISPASLRVVFRGSGHDAEFGRVVRELQLDDVIFFEPVIPYRDALAEMTRADGLLILQASNSNSAIPAKLYEYLRARRPILALTDPVGDTADVLRTENAGMIAPLDSKPAIAEALARFLAAIRGGNATIATNEAVERHSRRGRTRQFAALLDAVASAR